MPGGLEGIERLVKLTVFVAVAPGFDQPHVVANGASELLLRELGSAGSTPLGDRGRRASAELTRGGGGDGAAGYGAGRVTAPSDADETSAAYFANTPSL